MTDETKDDTSGGGGGDNADDAVKRLSAKLDEVLGEKKKQGEKLRALEAAEAERKAEIAKREEEEARKKGEWEKLEGGWKTKLQEAEGNAMLWRSKFETMVIDGGLSDALDGAKVSPALKKAALALLKAEHSVDLSDDGKATVNGKPLADFVGEWAKSDTGKAFVLNGGSGGGAGGSGNGGTGGQGANPWDPKTKNVTEQGAIFKADPTRARTLAAQHGVKL